MAYWNVDVALRVVPNGVNESEFSPDEGAGRSARSDLGLNGKTVLLYVGRVCDQKGTDTLLEAFRQLRPRWPQLALLIVGPIGQFGEVGDELTLSTLREAGAQYVGAVDKSRLAAIYNACDIFVMPTRRYEMFGMAALEAQACGKAVVASDHGGLPEVLTRDSAVFFEPGSAPSLAATIEDLLANPQRAVDLAASARANALRFTWDHVALALREVYLEAGDTRSGPRGRPINSGKVHV